jgi:DnaJ-class molecular chaperone
MTIMMCPECDGGGEVLDAPQNVCDGRAYWERCYVCNGTGEVDASSFNGRTPDSESGNGGSNPPEVAK